MKEFCVFLDSFLTTLEHHTEISSQFIENLKIISSLPELVSNSSPIVSDSISQSELTTFFHQHPTFHVLEFHAYPQQPYLLEVYNFPFLFLPTCHR